MFKSGVLNRSSVPVPATTLPPSPPSPARLCAHVHACGKVSLLSGGRTPCRLLLGTQTLCFWLIPFGEKAVLKHDKALTATCKWDSHSEEQHRLGSGWGPSAWAMGVCRGAAHALQGFSVIPDLRLSMPVAPPLSQTIKCVFTRCQMPPEVHYHLWLRSTSLQWVRSQGPLSCTWSSKSPQGKATRPRDARFHQPPWLA